MRNTVVSAIFGLTLTAFTVGIGPGSQDAQQPQMTPEEYFTLLRQDIEKDRIALVGAAMGFNSQQAAIFWPIYETYQAELAQLSERQFALILDYARNHDNMTDEKARELGTTGLSIQEERLALLRRYFERVDAELGPVVATRFLQVENQLHNLIQVQVAAQIPLIGGR